MVSAFLIKLRNNFNKFYVKKEMPIDFEWHVLSKTFY